MGVLQQSIRLKRETHSQLVVLTIEYSYSVIQHQSRLDIFCTLSSSPLFWISSLESYQSWDLPGISNPYSPRREGKDFHIFQGPSFIGFLPSLLEHCCIGDFKWLKIQCLERWVPTSDKSKEMDTVIDTDDAARALDLSRIRFQLM